MKIFHIFHNFNSFGGAEEHIATLSAFQKKRGDDVFVFLIQSSRPDNQYYQRLRVAGVPTHQWPVWISRLSGDWDTMEAILHFIIFLLTPINVTIALLISTVSKRTRNQLSQSIEGRIGTILKSIINLRREQQLFLLLLSGKCRKIRPDLLHLHSYGAGLEYILEWSNKQKIPIVYQEHSTPDLTARSTYRLPTNLNLANIIIAVSETSANGLRSYCNVKKPIRIVPPIVSIDNDENGKSPIAAGQDLQILTIARLSEEKGLIVLLEAAELITSRHPAVIFTIFGEGRLRATLEVLTQKKQLQNHVLWAGRFIHPELPKIMQHASIFVLPSITEGLPLSIIEAMAWGMAIVSTNVGGIPDLIEDGITGFLCQPGDANDLAEKIDILINEPALRHKLGCAAQLSYQQGPYHPEAVVKLYESVYHEAIQ